VIKDFRWRPEPVAEDAPEQVPGPPDVNSHGDRDRNAVRRDPCMAPVVAVVKVGGQAQGVGGWSEGRVVFSRVIRPPFRLTALPPG